MFIDNFRNRASLNFLFLAGWVSFLCFVFLATPEIYAVYVLNKSDHFFGIGITIFLVVFWTIFSFLIALVMFFIESINNTKKLSDTILKNKAVKIFQILGVVFESIVLLFTLWIMLVYGIYSVIHAFS